MNYRAALVLLFIVFIIIGLWQIGLFLLMILLFPYLKKFFSIRKKTIFLALLVFLLIASLYYHGRILPVMLFALLCLILSSGRLMEVRPKEVKNSTLYRHRIFFFEWYSISELKFLFPRFKESLFLMNEPRFFVINKGRKFAFYRCFALSKRKAEEKLNSKMKISLLKLASRGCYLLPLSHKTASFLFSCKRVNAKERFHDADIISFSKKGIKISSIGCYVEAERESSFPFPNDSYDGTLLDVLERLSVDSSNETFFLASVYSAAKARLYDQFILDNTKTTARCLSSPEVNLEPEELEAIKKIYFSD